MTYGAGALVNWSDFSQARTQLGDQFVRILGYFREDGVKSIAAIEDAMRRSDRFHAIFAEIAKDPQSLQFGAEPLGLLSEHIEHTARRCVETRESPKELMESVARLRPLFNDTVALFDRETAAPAAAGVRRPVVFGRKAS